jgi:hypothetical protein
MSERNHRTILRRLGWMLVLLTLIGGLSGSTALAQEIVRQRAFVYGINAAFASTFTGSFAPPSTPALYLLADQTSIISPRMTQIYFWPITNEYKASWELLNEPVDGTLEIRQGGQVIQQTEATSYTIHYDGGATAVSAQLYIGAEAEAAQTRFSAEQKRFQDDLNRFYKEQQAWLALADAANQRIKAGEKVTIPPGPIAPEPIAVTSNGINHGIPVKLPVGSYQIQLRGPDGAIVPGSARDLVVFAARRSAIGYMVVPETRWTTPDQLDDPSAVIVGKANSQLYLVPHTVEEYPARAYALLQNPQQQASGTSEWQWVMGAPIKAGELAVVGAAERRPLTPYRVQQVPGATLGYQILPFEPNPERPNAVPDLVGFPLPLTGAGSGFEIHMVSEQGQVVPGSARLVRTPADPPLAVLFALSAIPLAVGAAVIIRRRLRMRLPRNIAG